MTKNEPISLRAMRIDRGFSLRDLAKKCGVNPETIASWERGNSFPNVPYIIKLEGALACRFDDIRWNVT